jgi:hypothetical protein
MPYIKEEARRFYDAEVDELIRKLKTVDFNPGDVNYIISRIAKADYESKKNYRTVNDVVGFFICAALEFYRKEAAPYEDIKEKENGSI